MSAHHPRCVENARGAIAENNGATLVRHPNTPEAELTPETAAEALEWLGNGNVACADDGELCAPDEAAMRARLAETISETLGDDMLFFDPDATVFPESKTMTLGDETRRVELALRGSDVVLTYFTGDEPDGRSDGELNIRWNANAPDAFWAIVREAVEGWAYLADDNEEQA